jgi:transposase
MALVHKVWVPDAAHEALRDLARAREAAKKDQLKARHRLGKFLLRHGRRPEGMKAWTKQHLEWGAGGSSLGIPAPSERDWISAAKTEVSGHQR